MNEIYTRLDSPVGPLTLAGAGAVLRRLDFEADAEGLPPESFGEHAPDAFPEARRQLTEYFAGQRREFQLQLELQGSEWELRVWNALLTIPHGQTRSYGQIAAMLGALGSSRAVGLANGRNPVAIIVPCHRVIGSDGSLTGYGGGLWRKRTLLDLEAGRLALRF